MAKGGGRTNPGLTDRELLLEAAFRIREFARDLLELWVPAVERLAGAWEPTEAMIRGEHYFPRTIEAAAYDFAGTLGGTHEQDLLAAANRFIESLKNLGQ